LATVSIAMATYNGAGFVLEQLRSFAAQTRLPDELVVGDDGSTDDTIAIIRTFAETAPFPVRVIINERNLGYRENFLRTALACRSTYVAFSDQDDVWKPHKLQVCVDRLEADKAVLCVHTATLVSSDLQPLDSFRQGITGDRVIPPLSSPLFYTYYGLCQVFRRDLLSIIPVEDRPEGHDPLGEAISHDRWVTMLASIFGKTATVSEPLVLYRQHGQNVTGRQKRVRKRDALARIAASKRMASSDELARLCDERADLLDTYARGHRNSWTEAAMRGAKHYRDFATRYRARAGVLAQRTIAHRLVKLAATILQGHYRAPDHAGLGRNTMVKDLIQAIAASPHDTRAYPAR
jgi:glycosyltransferase involved in cell wall biosynthesis